MEYDLRQDPWISVLPRLVTLVLYYYHQCTLHSRQQYQSTVVDIGTTDLGVVL